MVAKVRVLIEGFRTFERSYSAEDLDRIEVLFCIAFSAPLLPEDGCVSGTLRCCTGSARHTAP